MKRIKMQKGGANYIAALMGVSRQCVDNALSGRKTNLLAQKIRRCALNHGGTEVHDAIPAGQWLTSFDEVNRTMTARFWNGYAVLVNIESNRMKTVYPHGETTVTDAPSIGELESYFLSLAKTQPTLTQD